MFDPDSQQHAVLWASLWSCLGAVIGGICGGPVQQYLTFRWNFYIQLMFSVTTQVIHFLIAKETRATVMLDKEAKQRRKAGTQEIYGPNEVKGKFWKRFSWKEVGRTMWRPYQVSLKFA
jgi:MFS family permease